MFETSAGAGMPGGRRFVHLKLGAASVISLAALASMSGFLPLTLSLPLIMIGVWAVERQPLAYRDVTRTRQRGWFQSPRADEVVQVIVERTPGFEMLEAPTEKSNRLPRRTSEYVAVRNDGTVFVIEGKADRTMPGERRLREYVAELRRRIDRIQGRLSPQSADVPVNAAIVFLNAPVRVRRWIRGVELLGTQHLEEWLTATDDRGVQRDRNDRLAAERVWTSINSAAGEDPGGKTNKKPLSVSRKGF